MSQLEDLQRFMAQDYSALVGALWTVTGSRSVAEDLVQDALARVLDAMARGRPVESFGAYVRFSAFNLSRNYWRSRWREARALRSLSAAPAVGTDTARVDDALDVFSAMAVLSRREREAVSLFYQLDLSLSETAGVMRVSAGTVKTLLHRARAVMLERLAPGRVEVDDGRRES